MGKLYANVGKNIKILVNVLFVLECIACVLGGLIFIFIFIQEEPLPAVLTGLAIMVLGPIVCWIMSWFAYGYGELIDKSIEIARNTANNAQTPAARVAPAAPAAPVAPAVPAAPVAPSAANNNYNDANK